MNLLLYATTVFLWGTSWLAIRFQLGTVDPDASVAYRFALAALIMVLFCLVRGRPMGFTLVDHLFMVFQGICLFSTNFFLIYLASRDLTTGLVALIFSSILVMNILGSAIVFRTPITGKMIFGAALGLMGLALVFWPELDTFKGSANAGKAVVLAFLGTLLASIGMLTSAWNQGRRRLPVIQTNAYGMVYGTLFIAFLALIRGSSFEFDPSPSYVGSLVYLAVGPTVIGFWSYLTLIGRIGADRAAYVTVLFPVVAMSLSTWFEDYRWSLLAGFGVGLVLLGNFLVLGKR